MSLSTHNTAFPDDVRRALRYVDRMGKPTKSFGDSLDSFAPELRAQQISGWFAATAPQIPAGMRLGFTTRLIYDLARFKNTGKTNPTAPSKGESVFAAESASGGSHGCRLSQHG